MIDADSLYLRLGDLVRQHRRRVRPRLTQEEVAKRVGLTRTSITNIEKGRQRIQLHQLYDLAAAIETTPESLLPEMMPVAPSKEIDRRLREKADASPDEREWMKRIIQAPTAIQSKE